MARGSRRGDCGRKVECAGYMPVEMKRFDGALRSTSGRRGQKRNQMASLLTEALSAAIESVYRPGKRIK